MPEDSGAVAAAALAQPEVNVSARASSNIPQPAGVDLTESYADLEKAMGEPEPTKEAAPKSPPSKPASSAKNQSDQARDSSGSKAQDQHAGDASKKEGSPEPQENGKLDIDKALAENKPVPAPDLRRALKDTKAKLSQVQQEYEKLKSTPREDPQVKTLSEKLAAAEKHRNQLDEELRNTAYERSQEFKERYHTPFVSAYELGRETASQFKITDPEGNTRQGTADDFDTLMQIPDADTAAKWAEETYGPTRAAALMNHRQEVIKLARTRNGALQEAQKNAGEREKMRQEASTAQQKALSELWTKHNNEAAEKFPHWFKEREGDDKGNELLRKGYEFADMAFNGHNLPPDKLVEVHSALRNRAAAFGREAYLRKQAESRIKELETELEAYQKSEPKAGEGKATEKREPGEMDWERNLEANWTT